MRVLSLLREVVVSLCDVSGPRATRIRRRARLFACFLALRHKLFLCLDNILPHRRRLVCERQRALQLTRDRDLGADVVQAEAALVRPGSDVSDIKGLRLGIFIPSFERGQGGAEKVAGQLAVIAAGAGARVTVLCRPPSDARRPYCLPEGVTLHYVNEHADDQLAALRVLKFDLLVCFGMAHFYRRIPHVARLLGAPFVIQECTNPGLLERQLLMLTDARDACEATLLRRSVLAHAAAIRLTCPDYLESIAPESRPFAYAFYNAFTLPQAADARPRMGSSRKLIGVGVLKNANKNGLEAVRAFIDFSHAASDGWEFALYGENGFTKELTHLQRLGKRGTIIDHGIVNDIERIYGDAHALVIPSFDEGLPNVVVEALSYGVPCIGYSDCAGVAHLIRHRENGLLVERRDKGGLARALAEIADPVLHAHLSTGARAFAARHFDFEHWRHNWLEVLANAAAARDASGTQRAPAAAQCARHGELPWSGVLQTFRAVA